MADFTLWETQIEDIAKFIVNKRFVDRSEPGTGKTPKACVLSYWRWHEKRERTVWIQPLSLIKKNYDELLNFSKFTPEDLRIVTGPPAKRQNIYASDAKVFLFSFDTFSSEWQQLLQFHPDVNQIIVDEYHLGYSTITSKRTLGWLQSLKKIENLLILDGTDIDGRYSSVYPMIHAIEPRYYGSIHVFENYHAVKEPKYNRIVGWRNAEKLVEILSRHSVKRTFKEVHGDEAKVIFVDPIHLSEQHEKIYTQFVLNNMLELEDRVFDGKSEGVTAIRRRQLLAHPETLGFKFSLGKDERLEFHFSEPTNSAIFSMLVPEQERIAQLAEKCGRKVGLINGDTQRKERDAIDAAFRSGELNTIVGSPETMSVGYNWPNLDEVLYTEIPMNDGDFIQSYRRGIRGSRSTPLRIHILYYLKTSEEDRFDKLKRRSQEANDVDPSREVFSLKPTGKGMWTL